MFRGVIGRAGMMNRYVSQGYTTRLFHMTKLNFNKAEEDLVRKQLFEAVKVNKKSETTKIDDSLFDVLNNLDSKPVFKENFNDDLGLGKITQVHPRDIAKNIRVNGPLAGRTIDIHPGGVSYGLSSLNAVIRSNKVRYLKKIQSRYIPPAKYRKQLKREWWRRRFLSGFKELMAKVNDARRRGY